MNNNFGQTSGFQKYDNKSFDCTGTRLDMEQPTQNAGVQPINLFPLQDLSVLRNDTILNVKQHTRFRPEDVDSLKRKVPKFYDDPGKCIKLLKTFIKTHDTDFGDCWFVLGEILSHHDRDKFINETRTTKSLTPRPLSVQRVKGDRKRTTLWFKEKHLVWFLWGG